MPKKLKPHAISELAARMDKIMEEEQNLKTQLRETVPECLSEWGRLHADVVINGLINKGGDHRRYPNNPTCLRQLNCDSLEEFAQRLRKLGNSWNGIVSISIGRNFIQEQLEATFTAL